MEIAMVIVIRPKKRDRRKPGMIAERMIDWPTGAVRAERRFRDEPWRFTFEADVLRWKRERMEDALRAKREQDACRRALYVWVFWCPGLGGFAFRGWWTYLIGVGDNRFHGGGVKGNLTGEMLAAVMRFFPVDSPSPLFGPPTHQDWMPLFAHQYQRGMWCGKPQGKAAVWATVRGDQVMEILEPAGRRPAAHRECNQARTREAARA